MPQARSAQLKLSVLLVTIASSFVGADARAIPRKPILAPLGGEPSPRGVLPVRWRQTGTRVASPTSNPAPKPDVHTQPAAGAGQVGSPCAADEQCGRGTYCDMDQQRCARIRRHINVMYMFYRSRDRRFTEVMGIYWHRSGDRGYRVVFPLYWSFWSPHKSTRVMFPFYFDHRRDQTRTVVVPPVQYSRSPDETRLRVWPLLFYTGYRQGGRSVTLAPLFHHSSVGGRDLTVLPLLASFVRSDPAAGLSQGLIAASVYWKTQGDTRERAVFPLFFARSSPGRSFAWAAPLTIYRRDQQERTLASFPLFFHRQDSLGSTTIATVPPLYHHRSRDRRRLYLPPLLAYHRDSQQRTVALGPSYVHWGPKRAGFGVAPLLFAGWSARRRYAVLFPALWHFSSPGKSTTVVGPAYHRRRGERRWAGLVPLAFYHRSENYLGLKLLPLLAYSSHHGGALHRVISPFGFFRRDRRAGSARTDLALFSPLYYHHRSERWAVDLAPPFFGRWHNRTSGSKTTVLGPLPTIFYRRDKRSAQVVFPLFWRFKTPTWTTVVLGPGYYHRTATRLYTGVVPLLFYKRKPGRLSVTALPLFRYYSHESGHRRFLSPLFFYEHQGKGKTRLTHWGTLAPLYYHRRGPRWEVDAAPPLFAHWRDRLNHKSTLVAGGPLILHRSKTSSAQIFFPLFWRFADHEQGSSTTLFYPVFYHRRSKEGTTLTVAGPTYLRRKPGGWHAGVLPLVYFGRSDEGARHHAVVFPALWHFKRPKSTFTLAGPVLWRRTERSRTLGVIPLLFTGRKDQTSFTTIPPLLFHYQRDRQRDTSFTLAGLYTRRRTPVTERHSLWPVFHYHRDETEAGRRHTVTLLPLGRFQKDPRGSRLLTMVGGYWHSGQRTTAIFGPLYYRATARRRTVAAVPLAFASWDREQPSSRHAFGLMPAFYYSRRPGRRSLYTPLFGFRKARSSLLWYAASYLAYSSPRARMDMLLPLGFRHHNRVAKRTTVFALPGYFGRWSKERSTHVMFPMAWFLRRPHSATSVVFPAYWDFHRHGVSRTTAVVPLYWRHRDHLRNTTTHVTPLVWARRHAHGTDAVVFPLLWHFKGQHRSTTVAFPLYWRFKRRQRDTTVVFPVYWDFARGDRRTTVVANTLYIRDRAKKTYDFHFLPVVRVQRKRPTDFKISFVAGLFGYERIGANRFIKIFLIPIELKRKAPGTRAARARAFNHRIPTEI